MYSTANESEVDDATATNSRNRENIFEIVLSGGPPWGFTLTGGSEFGSKLYVKKVSLNYFCFEIGHFFFILPFIINRMDERDKCISFLFNNYI